MCRRQPRERSGLHEQAVTGVILAGGRATRMGGVDKGLIDLAGQPMIEHVIRGLAPQVSHLLINANRSRERYARYGYPVFSDGVADFAGPLAGIAAALERAPTELVLTVPCDGPWLPDDLLERLWARLLESRADVCVCHDGKRRQPVFGLFHRRLLPDILDYLASGERRLQRWLDLQRATTADFSGSSELFTNVNTPEERERVNALLLATGPADTP
ncbi:MAG: hypothetical protein B0D96_03755 [Candidatus Sedimenticola endophacoides]|uniref:Molybdenum cofactor guanylyltransferase n=1 Tax=Candidatus Sedimenticola endophacoides TaxID=2548426 RepID=A0A657PVI8_9GAMM|nr:MAG: hypothetical protein B0D94_01750 [Candidatus Sedimenticola endophacoides]OQX36637.1 MAG: hypothetical protein B0D96_03755 [Candidatus Sedimenticola endophacoides]OQX41585.1 MAG: hypothetical protein B0D89_03635 [Candidatus Sedimenticola endophacoides]OQX43695.1 MAG: hypothetical protein B0D88_03960 [Candidatus Sedimenticola endophacoides]OQX45947.1 MAG: hypothetical protein B0D86_02550 [Candidatus Sedimenticola endophacoides]